MLGGLAAAAFLSLALPERLPSVDLAQHARMLALITGHPEAGLMAEVGAEPNVLAPYWLFYLLAAPLTLLTGPYAATRLTLALFVAATPLAVGFWLRCRGSRPILAVFTALAFYGAMTGWGFVAIVAGVPVLALMLGLAERLADRGRWRDALGAALLLLALYYSHLFTWVAGIGGLVCVLAFRPLPWRRLLPLVGALAVTVSLAAAYRLSFESTTYMEAFLEQGESQPQLAPGRLLDLFADGALYGVVAARRVAVLGLWALLAVQLVLGLRRGRGPRPRPLLERLHHHRYTLAVAGLLVGYVAAPGALFLVGPRFPILICAFLPLALPTGERRLGEVNLLAAAVSALFVVYGGWAAGNDFTRRTECFDELTSPVRDPGRTLSLVGRHSPRGYVMPVYDHLGLILAARRGGRPSYEMFHTGVHALRAARPESLPERRIMLLHALPELYDPAMVDRFDTILTVPPADPSAVLGEEEERFDVRTCGAFMVAERRRRSTR